MPADEQSRPDDTMSLVQQQVLLYRHDGPGTRVQFRVVDEVSHEDNEAGWIVAEEWQAPEECAGPGAAAASGIARNVSTQEVDNPSKKNVRSTSGDGGDGVEDAEGPSKKKAKRNNGNGKSGGDDGEEPWADWSNVNIVPMEEEQQLKKHLQQLL